jgi:hypothetical protein
MRKAFGLLLPLLVVFPAFGDVIVVAPGTPGGIQGAIDAAQPGDLIELTSGVFVGPGNRDVDFRGKSITVHSQNGNPESCIIDCEGAGRGFYFHSGETAASVLEEVTVQNGFADVYGGGAFCDSSSSPTFRECIFRQNQCEYAGGGVSCMRNSAPSFQNCLFAENRANEDATGYGFGCGLYVGHYCDVTVAGCTFWRNFAAWRGGGLSAHFYASAYLTRCTFFENESPQGASMGHRYDAVVSADHCIFAFGLQGAAVFCELGATNSLACCDVYGNQGGDWVECIEGQLTEGNISADPLFCGSDVGDLTVQSDSPCAAENNPLCGQIGAWGVGCGGSTPVSLTSWGKLKAAFR